MLNDSLDMIYSGTCANFSVFGREMNPDAKDHRRNSKDKTIKQFYQEEQIPKSSILKEMT